MKKRTPSILFPALLVLSLSLSTGLANAQVTLTSPSDGANLSSEPTFAWTGGDYDVYLFITIFYYDLGYWSGYYRVLFPTAGDSVPMPSAWWEKVGEDTPCYWAVLGYNTATHQWAVSSVFSFTKGDARLSYLPDTGITECYDNAQAIECPSPGQPFYGQDAQYVTNPMSYTDNLHGTVTDNVTGFMWQREDDNQTRNWESALAYCEDLVLPQGGYTDWRLPDKYELQSIVDLGRLEPAIDTLVFSGTNPSWYWSSTGYANNISNAWSVDFLVGYERTTEKSSSWYVRCVRGQSIERSFTDNGDGTITENTTHLMWQKEEADTDMDWEQALLYCENLNLAGHDDWRLPDIKELRSIVDNTRFLPSIDTTYFPGCQGGPPPYWSSSTNAAYADAAWGVHFVSGGSHYYYKIPASHVRCVR